jgi:hypothetical protein
VKTISRTDVHRPSANDFDPQAYELCGVFDADCVASNILRKEIVDDLSGQGYSLGHGSHVSCGHCGTNLRYSALLVRDDVQQYIFVGETCLDNRFKSLTKAQFQALREAARLNRERETLAERIEALASEHACVRRLLSNDDVVRKSGFLSDVLRKFTRDGRLSENQIRAVGNAFDGEARRAQWAAEKAERLQAREAERQQLLATGVKAPTGRQQITGEVLAVKEQHSNFGVAWKATIKTDAGWLCWVTLPTGISRDCRGKKITLTATFKPSDNDPVFAFGSRPTNASLVA